MNLHHHSGHLITQLETLLLLVRTQLEGVAATNPQEGYAAFDCRMAHLRNACELVAIWAAGADAALTELLPLLAAHADSGAIAKGVMDDLCAPLNEHLGERYVYAAMAARQG